MQTEKLDLAPIKARRTAITATQGYPWRAVQYPEGNWGVRNPMFAVYAVVEQDMENQEDGEEAANARFAANAPFDVDDLILEIERLRSEKAGKVAG